MVDSQGWLEEMREWAMTDVVQNSRGQQEVPCPFDAGALFQHFYTATSMLHQVQHTQGMRES